MKIFSNSKIVLPTIYYVIILCASAVSASDICDLVVIAHRGTSGYVPEHTLGAYALAVTMGADFIEPDIVITSDGNLVALHDNELSSTTDIAEHLEFATRRRTQLVDGIEQTGWFTEDFTLQELKALRTIERMPDLRPGNARMKHSFTIPTFQEMIDLVKSLQCSHKRVIGIYPEIKHSTHFQRLGLPIERRLVQTLRRNGYYSRRDPVYIQSLEMNNLRKLHKITSIKLMQLYDIKSLQPYDQKVQGTNITYGDLSTPEGLKNISQYASAVGPDKSYIIPKESNNTLGTPTSFVKDAHAVGLKVHPYVFRAENYYLPEEYKNKVDPAPSALGDLIGEIRAYLDVGIDGLFSDQPDIAVQARRSCRK